MCDVSARYARSARRACALTGVTGAALAVVLLTGCAGHPASPRGSLTSCVRFGVNAIRAHVTVTALPDACTGLSQAEVNQAVNRALRTVAAGGQGKVAQRKLLASDSPYLAHLVRAVPATKPGVPPAWRAPSHAALSLAALVAWLTTAGLGTAMMARWITRVLGSGARTGRGRLPAANLAHFALAIISLLVWIGYLVTGITGLAWTACALLFPAAGVGMTLVFVDPARRPAPSVALPSSRHPPVFIIAAHIGAAFITILLGVLAAAGAG
jgi:hypothetical protein